MYPSTSELSSIVLKLIIVPCEEIIGVKIQAIKCGILNTHTFTFIDEYIYRWFEKGDVPVAAVEVTNGRRSFTLFYGPTRRRLAPETLIPRCAARDISFSAVFSNWTSFRTHGWLFETHTRDDAITSRTDWSSPSSSAIFSNYGRKRSFKKRITPQMSQREHRSWLVVSKPFNFVITSKNQRILRALSFLCHSDSGNFSSEMWSVSLRIGVVWFFAAWRRSGESVRRSESRDQSVVTLSRIRWNRNAARPRDRRRYGNRQEFDRGDRHCDSSRAYELTST